MNEVFFVCDESGAKGVLYLALIAFGAEYCRSVIRSVDVYYTLNSVKRLSG